MSRYEFAAGDEITAAKLNKNIIGGSYNAGETINGATLPVPVYQDTTDNEFYKCDADDTDKLNFVGFAISNGTDGNPIDIQMNGIVKGFSGLDEGEKYYVQDTAGTIGTSKGTYNILVGVAISTTELLILKNRQLEYVEIVPPSWTLPASSNTWLDWDLSGSIPIGAKFVEVLINCGTLLTAGVRKKGSSVERKTSIPDANVVLSMTVEVDINRVVERYGNSTYSKFTIVGYWI